MEEKQRRICSWTALISQTDATTDCASGKKQSFPVLKMNNKVMSGEKSRLRIAGPGRGKPPTTRVLVSGDVLSMQSAQPAVGPTERRPDGNNGLLAEFQEQFLLRLRVKKAQAVPKDGCELR
ncbi:uncharacterized protein EI97DRAFT_443789 [Westerdykella ornata]|uniref:Uncharacterized protein n=1 Tax=Westerdykella ornata TaxID=318751 RepID=A0A6A6JED8_WESOR|nr:uncharacterized protein EI97DRAFT_443789 [Westerdykella ornata]KAF2274931.1 hypothetical protein EI97DRAFT_443789 [Westerdykella ornata]